MNIVECLGLPIMFLAGVGTWALIKWIGKYINYYREINSPPEQPVITNKQRAMRFYKPMVNKKQRGN